MIPDLEFVITDHNMHFFYNIVTKSDESISDKRHFILHSNTDAHYEMFFLKDLPSMVAYFLHTRFSFKVLRIEVVSFKKNLQKVQ